MEIDWLISFAMVLVFIIGYSFITIEHRTHVNKATVALLMAVVSWALLFSDGLENDVHVHLLEKNLAEIFQVAFFLLGALAVVEIISQHRGFEIISQAIAVRSKKKLLWLISILTFFMSAILDNLTTTVVMITLLKKLLDEGSDRLLIGSAVVIAANAGGAWSPIGDVTTTMLWIGERLSSGHIIKTLFIPSFVCLVVSVLLIGRHLKGSFADKKMHSQVREVEPVGEIIFFLGIGLLIFVPIFKALTGLPPFMGILFALSVLWIITDVLHHAYPEREHLRVPYTFAKIDLSSVLFFVGILLAVGALYSKGLLTNLAFYLDQHMSYPWVAMTLGAASAVVDNVPLVAASMGMYSLDQYALDHEFWKLVAYAAGTGGSMLIIGSAAGVAFMGLEKVDFMWYLRKAGLPAMFGYLAGFFVSLLL